MDDGWRTLRRRHRTALGGLALALCCLLALPAVAAARVRIWVSPHGDNGNPGTRAEPLRTLAAAQRAERRALRARPKSDVVVVLRGGTYRLKKPLRLSWRDSGRAGHTVAYRAYDGERPLISGASRVRGSAWKLYDREANIWRAQVGTETRELYVNGKRATRARRATTRPGSGPPGTKAARGAASNTCRRWNPAGSTRPAGATRRPGPTPKTSRR